MLSRKERRWEYTGQTTIRSGAEVRVETGRESLALSLAQMDEGSYVIFELPGFSTAAAGAEQSSLDALRGAGGTAYNHDRERNTLWVKEVADAAGPGGPGGGTGVEVGR